MSEKPDQCQCCGFSTSALTAYPDMTTTTLAGGGSTVRDDFWYCELCASTMASTFSRYPGQAPSNTEVLKTVCYVGNTILATLEAHHAKKCSHAFTIGTAGLGGTYRRVCQTCGVVVFDSAKLRTEPFDKP
jgi:hypothetical protein